MIGETRKSPGGGPMSVSEIEHELGKLRANEDGTLALRSSVLNLIVVTDEESAPEVTRSVSNLAGRYPARAIVLISDPEGERNVDVQLSAFCNVRGGGGAQVCAEQVTIHAEGPPANHLESLAGPLLIPDLPVFLWYPGAFSPHSPEFAAMADLADRVIVDSAAREDREDSLREMADLIGGEGMPAVGDLQWVGLSPWRSLLADAFAAPERAGELEKIASVEILYAPGGECRALLLVGWLASTLGWSPKDLSRDGNHRRARFDGPSGEVAAHLSPDSPDARLRRVRLRSADHSFQVSRHRERREVKTTVMVGGDLVAERTVHLGHFDLGVLVGEELQFRGCDEAYEAALRAAVEVLDL
ncbi:MAG: glucose-6-phosphate dehydrogenase assembly protein OpcA [Actinomycetota bacterium]|jgi:glucose-6-phosphate dehydrogenase assembly protein OpcA|nr:glucose-6-phosphate dehydrogenase assembly protein OpcA [Actinomycetota bacterium]